MKTNLAPRARAVILLLLVATSGALAGIVGDRLVADRAAATAGAAPAAGPMPPAGGPWRWEPRPERRYAERLGDALELTAAQRTAIDGIIAEEQARVRELSAEVEPRFRAIAEETRQRVEDVLLPEQRERLRALREERIRTRQGTEPRWRQDTVRGRRDGAPERFRGDTAGDRPPRVRERSGAARDTLRDIVPDTVPAPAGEA
jgi:Spy/CpxP family protein refolding chaperone